MLSIRSDRNWNESVYHNFMTTLSDMSQDDLEFIIVRSLFDVDDDTSRIYQLSELSAPERTLLSIVNSTQVQLTCMSHENQTSYTYSIL